MSRSRNRRVLIAVPLLTGAILAVIALSGRGRHGGDHEDAPAAAHPPATPRPPAAAAVQPSPTTPALEQALGEEIVALPSQVRISAVRVEQDRVCAGRSADLSAEVDGAEPGLSYRWLRLAGAGAELTPGQYAPWPAPAEPGRYHLLFQVCRSLDGRRVGVLAEQALDVDVVDCGEGEADQPLRIEARDRAAGQYVFDAVHDDGGAADSYQWDFGDGETETTHEPRASHFYPLVDIPDDEVRGYRVRLEARSAGGAVRSAATTVYLRGQARPPSPPDVLVELEGQRYDDAEQRWEVRLRVTNLARPPITWQTVERTAIHDDGRRPTRAVGWRSVVDQVEVAQGGSFVGWNVIAADEVPADVVRVVDRLVGRDGDGEEVAVTYSPYRRHDAKGEPATPTPK